MQSSTTEGVAGVQPMSAIGVPQMSQAPLNAPLAQSSTIQEQSFSAKSINAETMTIPLSEEQLEIRKVMREVPAVVGIRKEVQEQMVSINVPIQRETVVIERRPYTGTAAAPANAFRGQEVLVQTKVEDIEVVKRPVIREEVVLRKDFIQESKPVVDTLRREDIVEIGTRQANLPLAAATTSATDCACPGDSSLKKF